MLYHNIIFHFKIIIISIEIYSTWKLFQSEIFRKFMRTLNKNKAKLSYGIIISTLCLRGLKIITFAINNHSITGSYQ